MNDYDHITIDPLPSDVKPYPGKHWYDVEPGVRAEVVCYPDECYVNRVSPNTEAAWLIAGEWLKDL